ncbi:hypothetical protein SAMN04488109_6816 [Chryseolinea serpens]|uniref:Uncharacterized protein n=1 Tax=Chryseolinea serpens TaxID=947013 RepID=A0A1M5XPV1_9BACT|nr:hypothetical protein [Chryseolinea serpens]SHI01779.1 hypothetical protein SAMN04488109_6816 [Chryseolinea serpens]
MKAKLTLLGLLFFLYQNCSGQQEDDVTCGNLKSVVSFLSKWSRKDTVVSYPLLSQRERAKLGHPMLLGDERRFYSSAASLPLEAASEFGIDNDGHCSYTVYFGSYSKDQIDAEGKKLRDRVLSCLKSTDWTIFDDKETLDKTQAYLFMSYSRVDIQVAISRTSRKNSDQYWLAMTMFRFTPL